MSHVKAFSVSLAMLFGAGALATLPATASPLSNPNSHILVPESNIEQVQQRKWKYNRWQHGPRKRQRDRFHRYRYGNYWYSNPFWLSFTLPLAVPRSGSAHVSWCYDRYRSYDVRTDTFMGYDGRRHRCNSPYD